MKRRWEWKNEKVMGSAWRKKHSRAHADARSWFAGGERMGKRRARISARTRRCGGASNARRRHGRRGASHRGREWIAERPRGKFGRGDDRARRGFEREQDFRAELAAGNRGGVFLLLLRAGDGRANFAAAFGTEGELGRLEQRERAGVDHEHPAPRERLHQIPLAARGEEPRGER